MPITPNLSLSAPGEARAAVEPLSPPRRPRMERRRRISVSLDQDRYIQFRLFAATHRLSGDDVAVIAIDRLIADHGVN